MTVMQSCCDESCGSELSGAMCTAVVPKGPTAMVAVGFSSPSGMISSHSGSDGRRNEAGSMSAMRSATEKQHAVTQASRHAERAILDFDSHAFMKNKNKIPFPVSVLRRTPAVVPSDPLLLARLGAKATDASRLGSAWARALTN